MADKSPKQNWRKIQFRLRPDQFDEANVLKDYDARSQLLGRADHDYIRRLLLIGHLFISKLDGTNTINLVLSSNESNNTEKELLASSDNVSNVKIQTQEPNLSEPKKSVGLAIRGMAGIFSGGKKTE